MPGEDAYSARLMALQQIQRARLEQTIAEYRTMLAQSHRKGWNDEKLLAKLIFVARARLAAHAHSSSSLFQTGSFSELQPGVWTDLEHEVDRLKAARHVQTARVFQRLAEKEAALAVSKEVGSLDCAVLSRQIAELYKALEVCLKQGEV